MELSLPIFAQRVTVFGSTPKSAATSEGVSSLSYSVGADVDMVFPSVLIGFGRLSALLNAKLMYALVLICDSLLVKVSTD